MLVRMLVVATLFLVFCVIIMNINTIPTLDACLYVQLRVRHVTHVLAGGIMYSTSRRGIATKSGEVTRVIIEEGEHVHPYKTRLMQNQDTFFSIIDK